MKHPYALEIRDLCNRLAGAGYTPVKVWQDYGESVKTPAWDKVPGEILAVDMSQLVVTLGGRKQTLQIILGNSPGEAVSDYTYTEIEGLDSIMDRLTAEHYNYWMDREGSLAPPVSQLKGKENLERYRETNKVSEGGLDQWCCLELFEYIDHLEGQLTHLGVGV
jgi:hypothetical protein